MEKQSWINKLFKRKNKKEKFLDFENNMEPNAEEELLVDFSKLRGKEPENVLELIELRERQNRAEFKCKLYKFSADDVIVDLLKISNRGSKGMFLEHVDTERQKELEDKQASSSLTANERFELRELQTGMDSFLHGNKIPIIKNGKILGNGKILKDFNIENSQPKFHK